MILYHGSYAAIEKPDLSFARQRTDFGRGFYLFRGGGTVRQRNRKSEVSA